eukprot:138461-Heterocapsa_arctica.AAC.1
MTDRLPEAHAPARHAASHRTASSSSGMDPVQRHRRLPAVAATRLRPLAPHLAHAEGWRRKLSA